MNRASVQDRLVWAFWVAAGVAFIGGLWPLVFGGTSSRIVSAFIPFTVAAAALTACGFLHRQGRAVTAVLYFVAGLALVYALLAMFSLPLQLAVLGSCPAPPAPCPAGLGRPLTVGENTGMAFAAGFALVAIFVGFFGLMVVFRRPLLPQPEPPKARTIPPVQEPKPAPPAVAGAQARNGAEPEEEQPELPAPEELPELPPHESTSETT